MADSGLAALDAMIERLHAMGAEKTVGERVARKAAPLIDAAIKTTASAGTTPEGQAWKPKKDGGRPLVHAAEAVKTKAVGNVVLTTLTAPTFFHHRGLGGKPTRAVIPDSAKVPESVQKAATEAAGDVFRELVEGR